MTNECKFSSTAMSLLMANLGYFQTEIPDDLEAYLESLLNYAYDELLEMKIQLKPGNLSDDMDQMVFAAWMYRKGVNGDNKTEMLKSIIRNRQVRNALADRGGSA